MAWFVRRAKRVSDPLAEKVRARIRGDEGNQHHDAAPDPSCFSGLVHAFLDTYDAGPEENSFSGDDDDSGEDESCVAHVAGMVAELVNSSDGLRRRVISDVCDAAKVFDGMPPALYRRAVVGRLREWGYNAGVCTTRWESSGGLTAGSYEYVDVVVGEKVRYLVDLDFKAEFEIARATVEYEKVVRELPKVMVAEPEELRRVVRVVAEAARRSMKRNGLHVPPWRKGRYFVAKWTGPYIRTVNAGGRAAAAVGGGVEIKCRAVGFGAGVVIPATARTR
ncbi:Arc-type ribbon-helix-helix-containing protein [Dioscorea alata]|uniref:Arc-type ribbon-helix-helix-containing protein n=1 Tax=Dioscorea alata TaxID=55571 RepID=A0ACB7W5N8_DIOAL|nr:Arc-type ribbon-helix-helix-containing protein [Dioscorea alata]